MKTVWNKATWEQRVCLMLIALLLACMASKGADITGGYTFTTTEQVTATKLNLMSGGTINTSFLTGKSAVTAPTVSYQLMLYDGSQWVRATLANTIYSSTNLIYGLLTGTVATNAQVAFYDPSAAGNYKSTLTGLFFEHDYLINGRNSTNTTNYSASVLLYDGTGYFKTPRSNLFNGWQALLTQTNGITNMTSHTALTNADAIWIYDSLGKSNKFVYLTNLLAGGGFQQSTNTTNGDFIVTYNAASNVLTKVPMSSVKFFVTNSAAFTPSFSTTNYVPFAAGSSNTIAHGLGATPSLVKVTLLANQVTGTGYTTGDEIELTQTLGTTGPRQFMHAMFNATTIDVQATSAGTCQIFAKTTGVLTNVVGAVTNTFVLQIRAWR